MYKIIFSIIVLCVGTSNLMAQDKALSDITGKLERHLETHLPEKIFVQTDKPIYLSGEIIWLKATTVDGVMNRPLDLSKIAYVELINSDQKPVMQAKIALDKGRGTGTFSIPVTLGSGIYRLRAYTGWMKNEDPGYYFEKSVTIINAFRKSAVVNAALTENYDIQFFPEGGNLVNGIRSTVGFRVVDKNGKGLQFSGSLVDQNNTVITEFQPLVFGIGRFSFTPAAGNTYKAIIKLGTNQVMVADLPRIFEKGWVMHATPTADDDLDIELHSNLSEDGPVYCMLQTRQVIRKIQTQNMVSGAAMFRISKKDMGEGISQITIFNEQKQPVCERLYFIPPIPLTIKARADQDAYPQRKKVNLFLETEKLNKSSDLCISVYLEDSLQGNDPVNILNYLWLQSDLPGTVESASYYFDTANNQARLAADNLMLTQGWRRYKWQDILRSEDTPAVYMPEHQGHIVNGRVVDKRTGVGVPNVNVFLSAPGQHYQLAATVSKPDGSILFDLKNFYGTNGIVLQAEQRNDSLLRIDINNPFSNKFSANPIAQFRFPRLYKEELLQHSVAAQVQNIYYAEELNSFNYPARPDSSNFYGQPDRKYFLDEYTRFPTMEEVLREYVSDLLVRKHNGRFFFRVLNDPRRVFFEDPPLTLLDGVPVLDATKIVTMDPLKIKKIELVSRQFYLGSYLASGIISFSTYKGDLDGISLDSSALVLDYDGCRLQREFYNPKYETPEELNSRMPDFRNVLCWKPSVQTDSLGHAKVSFYTSDQTGRYIGCVQGLNENGKAGLDYFYFEVQKRQR